MDISYPNFSDYLKYIPLLTPAIDEETYQPDFNLSEKRILIVALATLAAFAATILCAPKFVGLACCILLLMPLDGWLSARAANALAVKNYIAHPNPSEDTFQHISRNSQAAKWLVREHADLNKTSLSGKGFLDFSIIDDLDFNFFKLLVEHGYNWEASRFLYRGPPFLEVVACKNLDYLEYLLKHGQIQASDFTPEDQMQCWIRVGNTKAIPLLVKHGFNINIQDSRGMTPLLESIAIASDKTRSMLFKLDVRDVAGHTPSIDTLIRLLLENGADPYLSFSDGGVMKNAFQLNTDPEIALILNEVRP